VTDNGEEAKCTDIAPTLKAATGDWQVSFDPTATTSTNDLQHIEIKKTVEAKIEGAEELKCGISYKLLVKDGSAWVHWDTLVDTLLADNPNLSTIVKFDQTNADFMATFTLNDYEAHKARFTDAITGEVAMYYKSVPIVAGSSVAGPTTPLDTLTGSQFKITFVEPSAAEKCEIVQMSLTGTYDGVNTRAKDFTYTIGTSSTLSIKSQQVYKSTDCPTVTVLEFKTSWGEWMEIRNGHESFVVDTTSNIKKIDLDVT
jgi:hypothetical protein